MGGASGRKDPIVLVSREAKGETSTLMEQSARLGNIEKVDLKSETARRRPKKTEFIHRKFG